ncbi:hypothetical protein [Mesorhizobium sp. M0488]|uniref:hypothetical protein n=1 Tax=unclassified Mesorhizobium TaxID=325217 RepID=UPI00333A3BFF
MRNEFLCLPRRIEHHRKGERSTARQAWPIGRPAMQPFAHSSIFRHGLSRCGGPSKSTKFYYSAKVFQLLSTTVMTLIRTLVSPADRRAAEIARGVLTQARQ